MVLDHPKIKSLNDIGPKKGEVWKLDALVVGGKDGVEDFIARYLPKDAPADWREFSIGYLEYNWNLNRL